MSMRILRDRIDDFFVVACVALLLTGVYYCVKLNAEKKANFMYACMKDKKEYECIAMWRGMR